MVAPVSGQLPNNLAVLTFISVELLFPEISELSVESALPTSEVFRKGRFKRIQKMYGSIFFLNIYKAQDTLLKITMNDTLTPSHFYTCHSI